MLSSSIRPLAARLPKPRGSGLRISSRPRPRSMATAAASGDDSWRANIIEDDAEVAKLVRSFKKVAVLGIKTERQADQPAFYVAEFLKNAGVQVVPVPTYYPDVTAILGAPVFRTIAAAAAAEGALDCVDVFRRPSDVESHVPDILAAVPRPRVVWLQSGIRCPPAEEALARAGVAVVADRCLMVEHRAAGSRL